MVEAISFSESVGVPKAVQDYVLHNDRLLPFISGFPSIQTLLSKAKERTHNYPHRNLLHTALSHQQGTAPTPKQAENLQKVALPTSVTITTGHQLNLMGGPMYLVYKCLHVIKLCEELNQQKSEVQFVPVFWMASEDHDFQEINHFYYHQHKIDITTTEKGPVGRMKKWTCSTAELPSSIAEKIKHYYVSGKSLSECSRALLQDLFGKYGLLLLDADDAELKKTMIPYFKQELIQQVSFEKISLTNQLLKENKYNIQAQPRELNLFYMDEHGRNRIEKHPHPTGDIYTIVDTLIQFTEEELIQELYQSPEKFSPNALLRPLYQEVLLPNIAYIGGNAEINYWLQLKNYFDAVSVSFPILIPRNSFFIVPEKTHQKLTKLHWKPDYLFMNPDDFIGNHLLTEYIAQIDFAEDYRDMETIYNRMIEKASQTDITLRQLLEAQKHKHLKTFESVQKRLIKAEKRVHKDTVQRFQKQYKSLFPSGSWQERRWNYFEAQENYTHIIDAIYNQLDTLNPQVFYQTM